MYSSIEWKRALAILFATAVTFAPAIAADPSNEIISTTAGPSGIDATASNVMSLDDIQDVANTLQHIRHKAIGIFEEATRKKVTHFDVNRLQSDSMPKTTFEDSKYYLPLRKGWLAYFIGTMEPLVNILNTQLNHVDEMAKRHAIPAAKMPEWHDIVTDWTNAVHDLDKQLDRCAQLLDEPSPGNVEVAKSAQAIDRQVSVLQDILLNRVNKLREEVDRPN
jgi:hypothetical protein